MERLTKVLNQLKTEERQVQSSFDSAKADARRLSTELQKIRKAISTLEGDENKKRTVTTDDVVGILSEALRHAPIPMDKAKAVVRDKLSDRGISQNGIALRFKQAITKFYESDGILFLHEPPKGGSQ